MPAPPSIVPFADVLADLVRNLRRGSSCLVVCDKGWTGPICAAVRERLKPVPPDYEKAVAFRYLDWRPATRHPQLSGNSPLPALALQSMRDAVRATFNEAGNWTPSDDVVFALPYLDVLTATAGGWTAESREIIVLLNENPTMVWLGFCDPSVELPPLVRKVFTCEHRITASYSDALVAEVIRREEEAARAEELAAARAAEAAAPPPEPEPIPEPEPAPQPLRFSWEPPGEAPPPDEGPTATSSPGDPG